MALSDLDDFTQKLASIVSNGYLTTGIGIGHELGLFTAMIDIDRPATSAQIADKAGCKERLVREWLQQMAVGRIVEMDQTGFLYSVPIGHRAGLQSTFAALAGLLPPAVNAHTQLMSVFKKDGPPGLTAEEATKFIKFWERTRPADIAETIPQVLAACEGLHEKLTSGVTVVDLGAGVGHLLLLLGKMYPKSIFTGVELRETAVTAANKSVNDLPNVTFTVGDVCKLPSEWTEKFEVVLMFDVLHDLPFASKAVPEAHRITKGDGLFVLLEMFSHSNPHDNLNYAFAPLLLAFSMYYCLSTSLNHSGSEGLGTCAGVEKFTSLLVDGGFDNAKMITKQFGFLNVLFACKK